VNETEPAEVNSALRQLWARKKIVGLSDFNFSGGDSEKKTEITNLGLKYNLLTAYTSFIAVHEIVRNPEAKSQDVNQPLPLPAGVSDLAVGGGVLNTPEPEFYYLIIFMVMLMTALAIKRKRKLQHELSREK
jgi:Ca-activated chloride channel homolog